MTVPPLASVPAPSWFLAQPLHQRMNESMLVSPLLSASSTCRPPTQQPAPRGVSAWWNAARGAAPHQAEGRPLEVAVLADLLVERDLGFGRIVASEIEAPSMLANLV